MTKVYISLPIGGFEKTVRSRYENAKSIILKHMSDDQLTSWLLAKGLTNDREGCLEGIRREFPWMLGTTIK